MIKLANAFKRYAIFLFMAYSLVSYGKQSPLNGDVVGIWYSPTEAEDSSFEWKAAWIWADEALDTDAIFIRRTLQVSGLPEQALLRITASSVYQLYINGEYICRGPARSAPHHQSYDILDITKALKTGENLIAVRVHHQNGRHSYQYEDRAGFLAQLNLRDKDDETVVVTDSGWKILLDRSWDNNAPLISRFHQEVNDRVDFRNYPKGWENPDFDDSEWNSASELMRKTGWPSPQKKARAQSLIPPWTTLTPRDIPYLIEKNIEAVKLIETARINASVVEKAHLLAGNTGLKQQKGKSLELPVCSDSTMWLLIYDFGEVINGMPRLDLKGSAGTEVEIISAPFIVNNSFTHITVDSELRDKILLSGNRDQWEATYFKPTRYLGIVVNNKEGLQLFSAGIRQINYPFSERGSIQSDGSAWVNRYMQATAKTINVCTTDGFTDNYRERRQYAQTGYYGAMGNYWIFGDYALQRRYLLQVAREQFANGIMPAYAPAATGDYMIIIDSNCLWIRSLRNYLLFSGDEKTVRELLPPAEKLMDLLHGFTSSSGLLDNPPFAYWLDHALNDRRGANFNLNGHYLGALEDFAQILDWMQQPGEEVFRGRAAKVRKALQRCWDDERQLFADALIDGKRSEMFSEHAQAMALAMNVATAEQAAAIARQLLVDDDNDYIKRESGITMVTPAMSYFLHKGLCNYGYVDESFELFQRRFDKMLQPGYNGTLWEEWWLDGTGRTGKFQGGRTRSDAQTESAFAPALFAEYLLGVTPTAPGMKEVVISRKQQGMNIEGKTPTPSGILLVKWKYTKENKGSLEVEVPANTIAKVDLKSLKNTSEKEIRLDGQKFVIRDDDQFVSLSEGNYIIEF